MFGRDHEIQRVAAFLDRATRASGVLAVVGPAGIGKSALLDLATHRAREMAWPTVTARPTAAEATLAFAVLGDLLRGADLGRLPDARRRVIEVALGVRPNDGEPPSVAELGFALLQLLDERVAEGPPLVIVVDDLQWADVATREVLLFVARRLPAAGVAVLFGVRTDPPRSTEIPDGELITLGPLDDASIARMVRLAMPATPPLDVLDQLVAAAGGNPLFAVELGRSMADTVRRPGHPLPVPASLGSAIAARFTAMPPPTMSALAAVAMLARPTLQELGTLGLVPDLLPAEVAGIVAIEGRLVTFVHPLLASAAHDAMPAISRLEMHSRLATVTAGTERSIHLALGATQPDAAIADELTTAAQHEIGRGAPAAAAELALLALDATPAGDGSRWPRLLLAGDALFRAGRTDEAVRQLQQIGVEAPRDVRAKTLLALATIEYSRSDDAEHAARLARQALDLADDPDLLAAAHTMLARVVYTDFVVAAEHADAALAIIRRRVPLQPLALADALNAAASARFIAGEGLDRGAFETAIELERGSAVLGADSAFGALASHLKIADELDEAQAMFETLAQSADPGSLPYALAHLSQLHMWAGRWDEAGRCARRHLDLAEQTGQASQAYQARFNLAIVAAVHGDVSEAVAIGRELYDEGRAGHIPWTERNGAALLGLAAMTTGDAPLAVEYLARYEELGESMRMGEPGYHRFHSDYVEALVATGDVERATHVLDRLAVRATSTGRVSAAAAVQRGRALVAAHTGARDEAFACAHRAVDLLVGTPLAHDRARTQLTLGIIARRFKERGAARQALDEALGAFEQMGARSLAERARRELDRVGGRSPSSGSAAALTPTEARVAELAAAGATTRQVADALFVSVKTVEANLTRIYRKLGLGNRAQLAAHLAARRNA